MILINKDGLSQEGISKWHFQTPENGVKMRMQTKRSKKHVYFTQKIPASINPESIQPLTVKLLGFMVWRMSRSRNFKEHRWLPLPRRTLRRALGGNYRDAIREAEGLGIIRHFKNAAGVSYSHDKGICKRYQFTDKYAQDVYCGRFFVSTGKQARIYSDGKEKRETQRKQPDKEDPTIEKLLRAYDGVRLADRWQNDLWGSGEGEGFYGDHQWAFQIKSGVITATRSDSGRLYHPLICMRKALRPFVSYKGQKIAYIDVKAAHPCFLANFADCADQSHWLGICREGIYERFVTDSVTSDEVKDAFQVAISYSPKGKGKLASAIVDFIEMEAPSIHAWLSAQWIKCASEGKEGNTVQFHLQKLESEIFVRRGFAELDFWTLPMHDGLAVELQNVERAKSQMEAVALEVLGFELTIEKNEIYPESLPALGGGK